MKKGFSGILAAVILAAGMAAGEGEWEPLQVTADLLNGRMWPTKKSSVQAVFDYGDVLEPTGNMSSDLEWLEVYGGETGTVWVKIRYVSERIMPYRVINEDYTRVKIRSKPSADSRLRGYVKKGKTIEIDRVVLGWGHCKRGWVDLSYFVEVEP